MQPQNNSPVFILFLFFVNFQIINYTHFLYDLEVHTITILFHTLSQC
jgi:hypothetical protein